MENYAVTVVRNGLAGLQTARLLSERGFRILLVNRKPSLDQYMEQHPGTTAVSLNLRPSRKSNLT